MAKLSSSNCCIAIISFLCIILSCNSQSYNYYVSPTGSDSTGDGSKSNPWATIQTAQSNIAKLISTLNKNSYEGNITLNLDPSSGKYQTALSLAPPDSMAGFAHNNYVIYQSTDPSQYAAIAGCKNITSSWTKSSKNGLTLYQTNLKSQANGNKLYELFTKNKATNKTQRISMSKSTLLTYDYFNISTKQILSNDKVIPNIAAILETNYSMNLMVLVYESWTSSYHYVQKIDYDASSGKVVLSLNTAPYNYVNSAASGNRFYLLNNLELLQLNNQFYYNQSSMDLFLLANLSFTDGDEVYFATETEIMSIKGESASNKVERLVFRGLHFKYSAIDFSNCLNANAHCQNQSVSFLETATVHTTNADHIVFDDVIISQTGGYALWFDQGTTNSRFINGKVRELGAGGIRIGVNQGGVVSPSALVQNIQVSNNYIEDGGHVFEAGCGILAQSFADSNISNNAISSFKYTGISTGWTWSYESTSVSNNIVARNEISNIGQYILSDMGCIYTLGAQPNCVYDNNICHDVYSFDYGGWGTYTDQASRFEVWTNNIVYNTKCAGHHQHYGLDNIFLNNIYAFVDSQESSHDGAILSSQHDGGGSACNYTSNQGACSSFTFITNIVYVDNTWGADILGDPSHTYWKNMTLDGNLYWSVTQEANLTFPDGYSIAQWVNEGKDVQHVLGDPLFVDAANYNFNLQLGSPAIGLGFHQIDTENVGPDW